MGPRICSADDYTEKDSGLNLLDDIIREYVLSRIQADHVAWETFHSDTSFNDLELGLGCPFSSGTLLILSAV